MARKGHRKRLKHYIHLAIDEMKQVSNIRVATLAFKKNRDAESLFIIRCLQAIIIDQNSHTNQQAAGSKEDILDEFEARRPLLVILLGALEFHLARTESIKLVLLGHRLQKLVESEIGRLKEALKILQSTRYVHDQSSRQRKGIRNMAFPQRLAEGGDPFLVIARMTQDQFWNLVTRIQDSHVFQNRTDNKQVPVAWQLLVALANLGSSGNGGDISHLAYMFHILEGSVHNWTNRCMYAILQIENEWVNWPNVEERRDLKKKIQDSHFQDCIGFMDGTLVPLAFAPPRNPEDYWTRKQFYAFNVMLVCDVNKIFRYYDLGWCGSAHDQRVYMSSEIYCNPSEFISEDEYLLADSGYTTSPSVITPFKRAPGQRLQNHQEAFNQELSKIRVIIEQSIGMLKGRFQSLKELRILITGRRSAQRANVWIRVCIILHNYTTSNNYQWHYEFGTVEEGLLHTARQRRAPPNAPLYEDEVHPQTARDDTRRKALFEDFIANRGS